ncbi:MAG: leucine-rich repeat protein [Bacteroidales bacterium]|nr:leucine-rich repeat protein [Candidatus Sodaliphilus limicaballi]
MKKLLSLLLLISIGVVAHATKGDIFAVGNLNYQVISEPTSSSWGYVGVNSLTDAAKATSRLQIIVPRTVANGGVTYRVKNIQSRAFEASDIQSVDIKYGVETLGSYSFMNCRSLNWVRIPSSVTTINVSSFAGCSALTVLFCARPVAPNTGADVFGGVVATKLSVYVPLTSETSVNSYTAAWKDLVGAKFIRSSLAYDFLRSDGTMACVTAAPGYNTEGELSLVGFDSERVPNGVWTPGDSNGKYTITGDTYKITSVASDACKNNASLLTLDLSNCLYLAKVSQRAFQGCSNLQSLTLNEGLQQVEAYAFGNCTSLKQINLPSTLQGVGSTTFLGCTALKKFSVAQGNKRLVAFNDMLYCSWGDDGEMSLVSVPADIDKSHANIYHPSLRAIGAHAFENVKNLTYIQIPYGVTELGDNAFSNCAVGQVVIPRTCTNWGEGIFNGATNLSYLRCNLATPPSFSQNPFEDCPKIRLYTPKESVELYKKAMYWKDWKYNSKFSFDIGREDAYSNDGKKYVIGYDVISTTPVTINDKQYDGCVSAKTHVNTLKNAYYDMPASVTEGGKTYAITRVDNSAFGWAEDCGSYPGDRQKFERLTLGENVDSVMILAFNECVINDLKLNASLKYVGQSAFYGCVIYNDVILPYGIKYLGAKAFGFNPFKRILVPGSANSINPSFLDGCDHLEEIVFNANVNNPEFTLNLSSVPTSCRILVRPSIVETIKHQKDFARYNVMAGSYDFCRENKHNSTIYYMTVNNITEFIRDGKEYAGKATYVYHPHIKEIAVSEFKCEQYETDVANGANKPYMMTAIGDSLLAGNEFVNKITLNDEMQTIGSRAFEGTTITDITIPASVTKIGDYAFYNCDKLKTITAEPTTVPTVFENTFSTVYSKATLRVHNDCLDKYKGASHWHRFFNIESIEGDGIKGDVNGDGVVDITDANILINVTLGKDSASKYAGADVTGDGVVDIADVNAVLNLILGK